MKAEPASSITTETRALAMDACASLAYPQALIYVINLFDKNKVLILLAHLRSTNTISLEPTQHQYSFYETYAGPMQFL